MDLTTKISRHKHWKNKSGWTVTYLQMVQLKSPVSNSWLEGVLYKDGYNYCVRSAVDFLEQHDPFEVLEFEGYPWH